MNFLFITPETFNQAGGYTKEDISFIGFPSLPAAVLAALTPAQDRFKAIDEAVSPFATAQDFRKAADWADLILISLNMTYKAVRAQKIARIFKWLGKKVVWGGVHVTSLFDYHRERFDAEIVPNADAVVLGEADEIWANVAEDARAGKLQKFYRASDQPAAALWPVPAYHAVNTKPFLVKHSRQATRGCPLDCEFCSVTSFNGPSFRKRNARLIADEIRVALTEIGSRKLDALTHATSSFFAFVDDNIGFDRQYFAELLMELIDVKREFPKFAWGGQTTLYTIDKKVRHKGIEYSLANLMQKSGCIAMFIGVESVSKESLAIANKNFNEVDKYPDQIKKFHDYGMMLNCGMVLGFDSDTPRVFDETYEFLVKNRVETSLLNILVPLPGTDLYRRYAADGRIFDHNWEHYDGRHVVYHPSRMSPEQLEQGYFDLWKQFYSIRSIATRMLHPTQLWSVFIHGKWEQLLSRIPMNLRYRHVARRIIKVRGAAVPNWLGHNITFAEKLLRMHESGSLSDKQKKHLLGETPVVQSV